MGHLHDDVLLLLRPEFTSFSLSYLNLEVPVRFKYQKPKFTQESNTLKDSGRNIK